MSQVLTEAQAIAAWGTPPKPRGLTTVKVDGLLFTWIDHPGAIRALERLSDILVKHGYEVRAIDTGTYNPRFIAGTTTWSRHAWPTAIDINWKSNPDGDRLVTDLPKVVVEEIVALRTNSGEQVWRWGGDWDSRPDTPHGYYDAMHFELIAHPTDLETGIREETSLIKEAWVNTLEYLHNAFRGATGATRQDQLNRLIEDVTKDLITRDELNAALANLATGGADPVARQAAAAAQASADRANADLAQIKQVIG